MRLWRVHLHGLDHRCVDDLGILYRSTQPKPVAQRQQCSGKTGRIIVNLYLDALLRPAPSSIQQRGRSLDAG